MVVSLLSCARSAFLVVAFACLASCAADSGDDGQADDNATDDEEDAGARKRDSGAHDGGTRDGGAPDAASDARARDASGAPHDSGQQATHGGDAGKDAGKADSGAEDEDAGSEPVMSGPDPEPGRLAGITAAHNAVRAQAPANPPLPELTWSPEIAAYAQEWADTLAMTACTSPHHRSSAELQQKGYGENLAVMGVASFGGASTGSTAQQAVMSWASEVSCWTYGTILGTEKCDTSCYTAL
ncbi:MAG TPA: CAP domain-containing protein, partial [Polyangiaceae bacterium]|nr:CAP domain-containing protein [Polyangiaceae bacterium]